jgi:hypothetical protein
VTADAIDFAGAAAAFERAGQREVRLRVPTADVPAWIAADWSLVRDEGRHWKHGHHSSVISWTGTGDPPLPREDA